MASRLNNLFQAAPKQFLERTVLFSNELTSPESAVLMRDRLSHFFDLQPVKEKATARVLASQHLYSDLPLVGYFVPTIGSAMIPRNDPPFRYIFLPEFTCGRLKIRADGDDWLRMDLDQNLLSVVPPIEKGRDSIYLDSFCYWDYTTGHLVGNIRATAVLVKEPDKPWTAYMQQIVGSAGFEQVRMLFSRELRY